jgi:hypothetical protein
MQGEIDHIFGTVSPGPVPRRCGCVKDDYSHLKSCNPGGRQPGTGMAYKQCGDVFNEPFLTTQMRCCHYGWNRRNTARHRSGFYQHGIKPQHTAVKKSLRLEKFPANLFLHPFRIALEQGIHPTCGWRWKSELEGPNLGHSSNTNHMQRRNIWA